MSIADSIDNYIKTQLEKIQAGRTIARFDASVYTFQTDAGQLVDKELEYTEHPDQMPALVFYTGKNQTIIDDTVEMGWENHLQEISIEGFVECDKAGTEGDQLAQDITAVLKADPWWGDLILEMQGFETDVAIQVGDTVYAVVQVKFSALYTAPFGSE